MKAYQRPVRHNWAHLHTAFVLTFLLLDPFSNHHADLIQCRSSSFNKRVAIYPG